MASPLAQPEPWDLVSDGYVSELLPTFERFAHRALDLAGVGPGTRVVDVACGPGSLALLAAARGAEVSALDFSPKMIDALRARPGGAGLDARVGDGMDLPYPDASFDTGFSMFGLLFFPDRAKGFRELARVLVPGGRAVVSSWEPGDEIPLFAALFRALQDLVPGMPPPTQPPLTTLAEMKTEMAAGGFAHVEARGVEHIVESPSLDAWWASMRRSLAPLVLMRHRLGEAAFAPIEAGIVERLRAKFGRGPQSMRFAAIFGIASR
jgi:ubiquinone/menaquinone biosynthesis C-methylase UbiE